MPGGSRLRDRDGNSSCVPVRHVLRGFQFAHAVRILRAVLSEARLNPREIVLIAVQHEQRLAVRRFDEILQRIQLLIVNHADVVKLVVHRAVGQLQELSRERRGVYRKHIAVRVGQKHVALHLAVQFLFARRERKLDHVVDPLRHLQMVCCAHGHADVIQLFINLFFRTRLQLVLIGQPTVRGRKVHVKVAAQRPSQPLTAIQQEYLRPQILQSVRRGRAGQPDYARKLIEHLLERQKAFGTAVLERRKLVDHQHVKGHSPTGVMLHQPFDVLAVDDVQFRLAGQRGNALLRRAENALYPKPFQMLPLGKLCNPCIPRHAQRRNNKNTAHLEAVVQQMRDGRKCDHRFSQSAVQKQSAVRLPL